MANSTENSLSIITWNIRGVKSTKRHCNKLIVIMNYVEKQNADVIFLQETHIGPNCYENLEDRWKEKQWTPYFTVYSPSSKGVAILVKKNLPHYQYICHDEDYAGGYIVLFCQMYGQLFTLVNLYNHKEDKNVLKRLSQYLQEMTIGILVIGGDFNTVLDLDFDKHTESKNRRHTPLQPLLQSLISSLNLQDTWSRLHPTEQAFSYSQKTSHSRLDMFFMQQDKASCAQSCEIHTASGISDHKPVSLMIQVPKIGSTLTDVHQKLGNGGLTDNTILDRRAGKISGAEVLIAMKSLTDSSNGSRDEKLMETETLKHKYNGMLSGQKQIPDGFNVTEPREQNIFATILANRLQMYQAPSFRGRIQIPPQSLQYIVSLARQPLIQSNFLRQALKSIDIIQSPPKDFIILKQVLFRDFDIWWNLLPINLEHQGPLTQALLYLCLKYMEHRIQDKGTVLSVSRQRLSLLIHMEEEELDKLLSEIRKESKLSFKCTSVEWTFKLN